MSVLQCDQPTSLTKQDFDYMIGHWFVIWNTKTNSIAFEGVVQDVIKTATCAYVEAWPAEYHYRKREPLHPDDPSHDEHYLISGETGAMVWMDLDIILGRDPGFEHFSAHRVALSYM